MTRKRYQKLLMSYRIPRNAAAGLAAVCRRRYGRYALPVVPHDNVGYLVLGTELRRLGYVPSVTVGVAWALEAGAVPPAVPRAK